MRTNMYGRGMTSVKTQASDLNYLDSSSNIG